MKTDKRGKHTDASDSASKCRSGYVWWKMTKCDRTMQGLIQTRQQYCFHFTHGCYQTKMVSAQESPFITAVAIYLPWLKSQAWKKRMHWRNPNPWVTCDGEYKYMAHSWQHTMLSTDGLQSLSPLGWDKWPHNLKSPMLHSIENSLIYKAPLTQEWKPDLTRSSSPVCIKYRINFRQGRVSFL